MSDRAATKKGQSGSRPPRKRAPAKKAGAAKKADPAKSSAPKAASAPRSRSRRDEDGQQSAGGPSGGPSGMQVAARAMQQLELLTGKTAEGVTGLERTEDGWTVLVEAVELRRVPATTDVLATYEVETDEAGELMGYHRRHRFVRGTPGDE